MDELLTLSTWTTGMRSVPRFTSARLVFLLLLLSTCEWAQPAKPSAVPAPAAPVADQAKEAMILERNVIKVMFEADGTGTREEAAVFRVLSQAGVQDLAVLTFPYSSANQSVEFDYVRVRKPDGTVIATPEYNILDMPADVTRGAPMYSDTHEKHVTVKALGVGDVLEYLIRYRTVKPPVPGQFWFEHTFPKDIIAKDVEVEISMPRDRYVKVVSPDYKPEIKDDGARRTYLWKTANLERKEEAERRREAPPPSVQLTTFRSWDEVGRWYDELQRPQLIVTPQLQARAAELTKGLTSEEEKIRVLYDYVSTRFHYVSLSFGIGRYQPHRAEDVLENEYGDCKDKHTLFAALLNAAGIDAWPAAINASRKIDPDVPSPGQFDHVITYVPRGDKPLWLDTTPEVAPFELVMANLRDKMALVIPKGKPAELKRTPANPPFPSSRTFVIEGKLNAEGTLNGHVQQTVRGDAEVIYRYSFRKVPEAQWKDLAQRISAVEGFGGEVSNVNATPPEDTRNPFEFSYDYTRKEYSDWANRRVTAPFPPMGVESAAEQQQKPSGPVELGSSGEVVYTAKIELPPNYSAKLPASVDLSQPYADFHSEYKLKDNVIMVVRRIVIKQSEVPLESWSAYRKFAKSLADDWGAWIELNDGRKENASTEAKGATALADASPDQMEKYKRAWDALERNDTIAAEEIARGLLDKNPNAQGIHALLGYVYVRRNDGERAIEQFRKEEELYPGNTEIYRILASFYLYQRQNDNAADQFRKWLKVDPKNYDATLGLSEALNRSKKYAEVVAVWEKAHELMPDSSNVRYSLALAYIKDTQFDKGMPLIEKELTSETKPMAFNNIAYLLADGNLYLDKARDWGDKALLGLERESLKAGSEEDSLTNTRNLGATWDTVGWIHFRRDELEKAGPYLRAAFALTQSGDVGDHLGQLLEKQGKKEQAAHYYLLAMASLDSSNKGTIREHYVKLTGKEPSNLVYPPPSTQPARRPPAGKSGPSSSGFSPGEELSRSRSYKILATARDHGSATFSVVFSPGKIEDARFVSGDEKLKPMASSIAASQIRADFPNADPVRITRRGILVCGSLGCDFVLLLPDSVHATE